MVIGCDYHPDFQQIAFVDTETGELQERRLEHREEAETFYNTPSAQFIQTIPGSRNPLPPRTPFDSWRLGVRLFLFLQSSPHPCPTRFLGSGNAFATSSGNLSARLRNALCTGYRTGTPCPQQREHLLQSPDFGPYFLNNVLDAQRGLPCRRLRPERIARRIYTLDNAPFGSFV